MNELKHYGVQGMRWGVRRYENKDGTLTEAGKKRYTKNIKRDIKKGGWIEPYSKAQKRMDALVKESTTKYTNPDYLKKNNYTTAKSAMTDMLKEIEDNWYVAYTWEIIDKYRDYKISDLPLESKREIINMLPKMDAYSYENLVRYGLHKIEDV